MADGAAPSWLKDYVIPLITAGTGVMVAVMTFWVSSIQNDLKAQEAEIKRQEQVRLAREAESKQQQALRDFDLKIYEAVVKSVQSNDQRQQQVAKALVVAMVEDPLRTSLLDVLKNEAAPEVKAEVAQIISNEQQFKAEQISVQARSLTPAPDAGWRNFDYDIFWCANAGKAAEAQARKLGDRMKKELKEGAQVRVRPLPASINASPGYHIAGYVIRYNTGEDKAAEACQKLGREELNADFQRALSRQQTPSYVSMFVCPTA